MILICGDGLKRMQRVSDMTNNLLRPDRIMIMTDKELFDKMNARNGFPTPKYYFTGKIDGKYEISEVEYRGQFGVAKRTTNKSYGKIVSVEYSIEPNGL
jgi:hypothetical protein